MTAGDVIVGLIIVILAAVYVFMVYMMTWGLDEKNPPWRRRRKQ